MVWKVASLRSMYYACMCIYCLHNFALLWAAYDVIPTISGKSLLASGLWGWCRHPNYFGWILGMVAAALTCGMSCWCFTVSVCVSMVPLWPCHMAQHRQLLADNVGHYFVGRQCRLPSHGLIVAWQNNDQHCRPTMTGSVVRTSVCIPVTFLVHLCTYMLRLLWLVILGGP